MSIRDETGVRLKGIIRILEEGFSSGEIDRYGTVDGFLSQVYAVLDENNSHFIKKMSGLVVDDYEYR